MKTHLVILAFLIENDSFRVKNGVQPNINFPSRQLLIRSLKFEELNLVLGRHEFIKVCRKSLSVVRIMSMMYTTDSHNPIPKWIFLKQILSSFFQRTGWLASLAESLLHIILHWFNFSLDKQGTIPSISVLDLTKSKESRLDALRRSHFLHIRYLAYCCAQIKLYSRLL